MPTPGGEGIQPQVTELGQRAANFHNNWLLLMCAVISVFVLALLVWTALCMGISVGLFRVAGEVYERRRENLGLSSQQRPS